MSQTAKLRARPTRYRLGRIGYDPEDGMSEYHNLVRLHGRDRARTLVKAEERKFVDLAAEVMADHRSEVGYTNSGFCMTSLPQDRKSTRLNSSHVEISYAV